MPNFKDYKNAEVLHDDDLFLVQTSMGTRSVKKSVLVPESENPASGDIITNILSGATTTVYEFNESEEPTSAALIILYNDYALTSGAYNPSIIYVFDGDSFRLITKERENVPTALQHEITFNWESDSETVTPIGSRIGRVKIRNKAMNDRITCVVRKILP